jgi:hypothetical protein
MLTLTKILINLFLAGQGFFFGSNAPATGVPSTPWVTGQSLGTPQSNLTGCVGVEVTVGGSNITVTDVGRWVISGNSQMHTITIQTTGGSSVVAGTVNTSGAMAGQFLYVAVTPTVLTAAGTYWIGSSETNGGDQWYDDGSVITVTAAATAPFSAYNNGGGCPGAPSINTGGGASYGPVNFKYH